MSAALACDVPKRLRTRPKDRRGYPVPFLVLVDKAKRPHFTISDTSQVEIVVRKRLCGLCGKRLDDGSWFIAGPRSFLDPRGAFLDPASHEECGRFALRVCPYLAAPRYGKLIDAATLSADAMPDGVTIGRDDAVLLDRPPLFMFGRAPSFIAARPAGPGTPFYLRPDGAWSRLEYWQHGRQLPGNEGSELAAAHQARGVTA